MITMPEIKKGRKIKVNNRFIPNVDKLFTDMYLEDKDARAAE